MSYESNRHMQKYHSIHKGVYHKPRQTGSSSENEVSTSEFNNSLIAIINKTGWVNNHNTAIAIQKILQIYRLQLFMNNPHHKRQ